MNIRYAIASDLPTIVEIYNAAIPGRMATADTEPVSVQNRLPWFKAHTTTKYPIWVIEVEDLVIGWLSLQPFYGRPAYAQTAEVSIYVAPNCQRSGVGNYLLSTAIQNAAQLELSIFLGFIFAHNQPSIQLFTKFGFQIWGHLPKVAELDGIKRDLVIMGLAIEP